MEATSLYTATFMDHVTHPDYKYPLADATLRHEGINPSCGDELTFSVRLADDGTIEEAAFQGSGCAISQASADMMSDLVIDRTPEEAIGLCQLFMRMVRGEETDDARLAELDEALLLRDISHMPARVKCAELAWRTLEEMLEAHVEGRPLGASASGEASVGPAPTERPSGGSAPDGQGVGA